MGSHWVWVMGSRPHICNESRSCIQRLLEVHVDIALEAQRPLRSMSASDCKQMLYAALEHDFKE
jgi:hypothetical protein